MNRIHTKEPPWRSVTHLQLLVGPPFAIFSNRSPDFLQEAIDFIIKTFQAKGFAAVDVDYPTLHGVKDKLEVSSDMAI